MNYRHIYHAGGLADIVKHITLIHMMKRLVEKPAAFCVVDTHAAIGLYNLSLPEARKTGEAEQGVIPFCRLPAHPALDDFQALLKKHNPELGFGAAFTPAALRLYPGSPAIIHAFLRDADRLVAVEKHPEDAKGLKLFMGADKRIHIHQRDAWEAMAALIPPPEKRVLVFIDPPFEKTSEMDDAFTAIVKSHQRCTHGIYALWYPIKDMVSIGRMQERFAGCGIKKILRADVYYRKDFLPNHMNGCGMVIINPPWQLEESLREAYGLLRPLLDKDAPAAKIEWLSN